MNPAETPPLNDSPDSAARRGQNLFDLRDTNLAVLLATIWEHAPISRVELTSVVKLAPSSITRLVRELEKKELIVETGKAVSRGGRQPILIEPNPQAGVIICLDLSGPEIRAGLFDAANNLLKEIRRPFEGLGNDNIRDQVIGVAHELLLEPAVQNRRLLGIGASSPAAVGDVITINHNLDLHNFPLKALLEEQFQVPVFLRLDSQVFALTEKYYGVARSWHDFLYILVSNGVGSSITINDSIYQGSAQAVGEIGHIILDRNGAVCNCGKRGCLETLATRGALLRKAEQFCEVFHDEKLARLKMEAGGVITLENLALAARQNSPAALAAIDYSVEALALAITNTATFLGISMIVVGGDVPQTLGESFFVPLRRWVEYYNWQFQTIRVQAASLDWSATLKGLSKLTIARLIGIS